MEKNLSSAAFNQVRPTVPEDQGDIPSGYGSTQSCLLAKDPVWMFLFWEITNETFDYVRGQYGQETLDSSRTVIRLYDVTGLDYFDGSNAAAYYDMPVIFDAKSWYIRAAQSGRSYVADLGFVTPQGQFILLTRSNTASLPPGKVSDVIDDKWMSVEGDFIKLLQLSGADRIGLGASELMQVVDQRWRLTELAGAGGAPSSARSSWSSFALHTAPAPAPQEDEDIWLQADCEIIVYGSASPNAFVTVNGKEIQLQNGKFSLRQALPAGAVLDLPIKASNKRGDKTRQVHIKASREQGK